MSTTAAGRRPPRWCASAGAAYCCGLSQTTLAEMIGATYQQAHKYESGVNRLAASRLFALAAVLRCDVGAFFEGIETPSPEPVDHRHILDLARLYRRIAVPEHKRLLRAMAAALAGDGTAEAADVGAIAAKRQLDQDFPAVFVASVPGRR